MIHILPEAVANKIAAGEVVERPASIVKELLENSLDAGAHRLEVQVEAGGRRLILVEDDGSGMSRDDAMLAFERHATSKIHSADDLFEVTTLGFRGEALPSIAAVSRVLLETRAEADASGTQLEIHGGRFRGVTEVARPPGTRFQVRDVFYNTPARRKFLKSESTELGHITGLVTHYALAHPAKSFRLSTMSHEVLNAAPAASLRERLYQVMGGQTLEQLIEIAPVNRQMPAYGLAEDESGEPPSDATASISGFVSRPEIQKLNRNQIYVFVNRRLVRDRLILHAITEAYRNILPSSVYPVALLFLDLPPAEVDVNVHPSKTEVKFRHSGFIHDFARDAVRGALVRSRPMAAFPLPARPRAGDSPRSRSLSASLPGANRADAAWKDAESPYEPPISFELSPQPLAPDAGSFDFRSASAPIEAPSVVLGALGAPLGEAAEAAQAAQAAWAGGIAQDEFPQNLRALGQVRESFIVAANDDGLWIIDQHVAHERILFEQRLQAILQKSTESQRLLMPVIVELKPEQQVVFDDIARELEANGFEAEPFGLRTIAIKSAPAEIRPEAAERLLLAILDNLGVEGPGLSLDVLRHRIAATVACQAAIKVNMPLDSDKMAWLLTELGKTDCPMTCPHGRPVLLRYSFRDIQKAFKRI